ncbi:MAG: class I SAM-dependent methyltransferase [Anaerolineae bacterium]|nr:class I SAM-dependent methyltransferase [Anaerolineae bacterium]
MSAHVNYDQIAASYNRRYAVSQQDEIAEALAALVVAVDARRILEVGCGTGRWLVDLCAVAPQVVGLDFSLEMLRQAQSRAVPLIVVQGQAEQLPFAARSFNLIYCVNAIHHFDGQQGFVDEARRLLRSGGALAVVGSNPYERRESWYVYDYFDGTYETDLARFPTWEMLCGWMSQAGFAHLKRQTILRIQDHKYGRKVLDDPFLHKNSCSQLALLTDQAYAAGLARIHTALDAAEAAGQTLTFIADLKVEMLLGRV